MLKAKFTDYTINVLRNKGKTFWHIKLKIIYETFAIVSMYTSDLIYIY